MDTTRTVEITYSVKNAIRWFDDHDELYWNVTGNDWPVPIDQLWTEASCFRRAQRTTDAPKPLPEFMAPKAQDATVAVNGNLVKDSKQWAALDG